MQCFPKAMYSHNEEIRYRHKRNSPTMENISATVGKLQRRGEGERDEDSVD